jgi:hypothetical protein
MRTRQLPDELPALAISARRHRAGIDNDYIGCGCVVADGVSHRSKSLLERATFVLVRLTPKRDDANAVHERFLPATL